MINLYEKIKLLKRATIFREVATDDLRFVAATMNEEVYFEGDTIFNIHDNGNCMYVITSGQVGISLNPDKNDYISVLETGDSFGEMNLLDGLPRSASAVALKDTQLLSLTKSNLRGLILSYPEISLGILQTLSLRLRDTNKKTGLTLE